MTSQTIIDGVLAQHSMALAGVSRSGGKFGNKVLKDLTAKGYEIFPVHPEAASIDGVRCYASLEEVPAEVGALVLVVPPRQTENLVREAVEVGIDKVWMQPGAESDEAIRYCREHGIDVVHGECIMRRTDPR